MKKIFLILSLIFILPAFVCAGVPNEIRYTGRLKSYQTPVNDNVSMIFKLYYQENGGNSAWTSGTVTIPVSDGVFTYILKPAGIDWSKGDIWLELTVGANVLSPREKLMTQPYSFHAVTAENGVPAGTVIAFAGNTTNAPKGYLLCNGAEYNKDTYPDLFQAIGTLYGGNGSPYFKVPDFRGAFLRGHGSTSITTTPGGTITAASAGLGVKQTDAIRNIIGTIGGGASNNQEFLGEGLYAEGAFGLGGYTAKGVITGAGNYNLPAFFDFNASKVIPTSNENRPINYAVNYYIKH